MSDSTAPSPLRVGVVGLGFAGTTALDAFSSLPGVEVVALAGQEQPRLDELADSRGVPNRYHDWEDLVARDDLDVVTVGVPNHLHAPIAIAALNSGKHVFCEKPMAVTLPDADRAIDAARDAGVVLQVGFNRRFAADWRAARALLDPLPAGPARAALEELCDAVVTRTA